MTFFTSSSYVTKESANFASPPETSFAALNCLSVAPLPSILFSGTIVTRFASLPLARRALPVTSVSTTTWNSLPPATTSSAVAVAGSETRISFATTPFTRRRSNFASGSANLKSKPASWPFKTSTFSCISRTTVSAVSASDSSVDKSLAAAKPGCASCAFLAASNEASAQRKASANFEPFFSVASSFFFKDTSSFSQCFLRMDAFLPLASSSATELRDSASCVCRDLFPSPPAPVPLCTPRKVSSAFSKAATAAFSASVTKTCDASSAFSRSSSLAASDSCCDCCSRRRAAVARSASTALAACVSAARSFTRDLVMDETSSAKRAVSPF
mmetsp:Transcript_12694/g.53192  ORF Transcript_12694/g.53192 Transcript_12694/m.53192 type:complete len:329 (+) Transcript_12694:1990-2976(+)